MVKKYNISKPEKYIKNGVEKTMWHNVGTMTEFIKDDNSVSRIIEIPAIGLKASVFPIEPKVTTTQPTNTQEEQPVEFHKDSDVNPEDIPF